MSAQKARLCVCVYIYICSRKFLHKSHDLKWSLKAEVHLVRLILFLIHKAVFVHLFHGHFNVFFDGRFGLFSRQTFIVIKNNEGLGRLELNTPLLGFFALVCISSSRSRLTWTCSVCTAAAWDRQLDEDDQLGIEEHPNAQPNRVGAALGAS